MNPGLALAAILVPTIAVALVVVYVPIFLGSRLGWWK